MAGRVCRDVVRDEGENQKMMRAKMTNPDQAWSAISLTSFLRSDSLRGSFLAIAATGEAQEQQEAGDHLSVSERTVSQLHPLLAEEKNVIFTTGMMTNLIIYI